MAQSYSIKGNNFQGLILLWALGEAGLGGLIHATGVPITGLVVGGWAAVCMCLMAYRGAKGMDFIHALVQVLIIKAIASPHSPLPAYVAVTFQGLIASLIFGRVPWTLSVMIFPVLTMLESAGQKLLSITLVYGTPFWDGLEAMVQKIAAGFGFEAGADSVWWLAMAWFVIHAIVGIAVSVWIFRLPKKLSQLDQAPLIAAEKDFNTHPKGRTIFGSALILFVPLLVLLFLPLDQAIYGILRAWAALFLWFTLGTWMTQKFQNWLSKKNQGQSTKVADMLGALPHYRRLAIAAWNRSNEMTQGINRWNLTAMLLLKEGLELNTLPHE